MGLETEADIEVNTELLTGWEIKIDMEVKTNIQMETEKEKDIEVDADSQKPKLYGMEKITI